MKLICDSRNLIYVVISPRCKEEYIGKTGIGDSKLRDRVTIYEQHIRQPQHEILKVETILELAAKETSQLFYDCVQIPQSCDANRKITLSRNIKLN